MRNIKFRGKSLRDNTWVYGALTYRIRGNEKYAYYICFFSENTCIEVDPETVGEYTGLQDNCRDDVYEGAHFKIDGVDYYVEWHEDMARFILTTGYGYDSRNCMDLTCDSIYCREMEEE